VPARVAAADAEPGELDAEDDDEKGAGGEGGEDEDWDPTDEDLLPDEIPPMEQLPAATVLERAVAMVARADKFLTHEKVVHAAPAELTSTPPVLGGRAAPG